MEIGGIVSVSAILVAIFLSTLVFVWQIHSQGSRLSEEIRSQGSRISEVEREQARLDGANVTLSEVLRRKAPYP